MAKRLDFVLVIDVEATCWEKKPPAGQWHEIIQVGIIKCSPRGCFESMSYFIKPKFSSISDYCTELTGIRPEEVDKLGIEFPEFCTELAERIPYLKEYTWASWGDYDRTQFHKNCKFYKVKYPFGRTHLNIKNLFALKFNLPKEVEMIKTLEILKLPHIGKHHDAIDDAMNIARILRKILWIDLSRI